MFTEIKQQTRLVDIVRTYCKDDLKEAGDSTYELSDQTCPMPDCGHRNCFRIKIEEPDSTGVDQSYYKCFSCGSTGDAFNFLSDLKGIEVVEAGKEIAKTFNIRLPQRNPTQEIFDVAADYYHNQLLDTERKIKKLGLVTPKEYQAESRGHKPEVLSRMKVGFTDGNLKDFLESIGFESKEILESGLVRQSKNNSQSTYDFFKPELFIYPHLVNGHASHFTIKDPSKEVEYQLPKKYRLNNSLFYSANGVEYCETLALVEGENDLLSLLDAGWTGGILAAIGSYSRDQIEHLRDNFNGTNVITFFDSDDAGQKYRDKVSGIYQYLGSLHHAYMPEGTKDVDDYLKNGGSLSELIDQAEEVTDSGVSIDEEDTQIPVFEEKNRYYTIKYDNDGNAKKRVISDFVIRLSSIYLRGSERNREVVIVKADGTQSVPAYVDSTTKVNLKNFKVFVANAADATFYGTEIDLADMWKRVYLQNPPHIVNVPLSVGSLDEQRYRGWMFRNVFIDPSGNVIEPDKEGIYWIDPQQKTGVRPTSLASTDSNALPDVPELNFIGEPRHRRELTRDFIANLGRNLGSTGDALVIASWGMANCFSDTIYNCFGFFPFLFLWGRHGKGKTNIVRWILSLYNMQDVGYTTVAQLGSTVGFTRKAGYYSSLPMAIDEVRKDQETKRLYPYFRGLYNRSPRTKGVRDDFGVKAEAIRATFVFAGEDIFDDSALATRCLPIKVRSNDRDLTDSYQWLEMRYSELSGIGLQWIIESADYYIPDLKKQLRNTSKLLMDQYGCTARTAQMWSISYVFGQFLCDKYIDGFDYWSYIVNAVTNVESNQESDSIISQFFSVVEGLQVGRYPKITADHISRQNNHLHIWFAEVHRIACAENHDLREFTKRYFIETLREEPYFVGEDRAYMADRSRRRVITLDLDKAPEVICNIGQHFAVESDTVEI